MTLVTQGFPEKYGKRLIGKTDMEDALKRLHKLTNEEARMATAENLRATHAVDERVRGVTEQILAVDERVANVNDRVTEVIHGVCQTSSIPRNVYTSCSDGKEARQVIEQAANDVDRVKRSSSLDLINTDQRPLSIILENQLRESVHNWLSPPDPSTNHNIACDTHHKKIATWFFDGSIYQEWKSKGSLLWIHGKRAPCPNFPSNTPLMTS